MDRAAADMQAELARLCQAYQITAEPELLHSAAAHFTLLLKWNQKISLTTITDPRLAARQHYFEPLFAARYIGAEIKTAADIGSGGGFPGLPFALARPDIEFTLVEANRRKAAFLGETRRELALKNLTVTNSRFETLPGNFQLVSARALERFETQLAGLLQFARASRQLLLFLAHGVAEKVVSRPDLQEELAFWHPSIIPLPESENRALLVLERSELAG